MGNRSWYAGSGDEKAPETTLADIYRQSVTWVKPPVRWADTGAGQERVYQCAVCHDMGVVVLPQATKDETDEDLMCQFTGIGVMYYCPKCRPDAAPFRPCLGRGAMEAGDVYLSEWQRKRLWRWLRLRQEELAVAAAGRVPRREVVAAAAPLAKGMPALSAVEEGEIAEAGRSA